ncbi:hypothetical protein SS50377_27052 [Spironucleus salmonicida]|uniref:Uncharacterized protein n=1 Tax=Spironucleus salmonicida TaxID=348837 RepID=V6LTQ7_9EUKA|nr:hypothetical protein SS50377_27049 [Spironucleus salmonicida]KAH0570764.1 hypothetical protein SS50377_27052 [Spironucleus salmonicida]|eukprot:EST47562.1 Hypothetical protein SS50377_12542 [Spironucleus salmonicida]
MPALGYFSSLPSVTPSSAQDSIRQLLQSSGPAFNPNPETILYRGRVLQIEKIAYVRPIYIFERQGRQQEQHKFYFNSHIRVENSQKHFLGAGRVFGLLDQQALDDEIIRSRNAAVGGVFTTEDEFMNSLQ